MVVLPLLWEGLAAELALDRLKFCMLLLIVVRQASLVEL